MKQHLLVVVFSDPDRAEAYRLELKKTSERHGIDPGRIVTAVRASDGQAHLHYTHFLAKDGAFIGGTWGTLVGLLFLNPLLGIVAGAGVGAAIGELGDFGIGKPFLQDLASHLQPNTSALFIPVDMQSVPRALEFLQNSGGVLLQTALTPESELELKQKLEVLAPLTSSKFIR